MKKFLAAKHSNGPMPLSMQALFLVGMIGSEAADVWREIARKTTMADTEYEQFVMDVRRLVENRFDSGTSFDETIYAKYDEYINGHPTQRFRALKALIAAGRVLTITGRVNPGYCFRARGLRLYVKKLYYLYTFVGDILIYTPKLTMNHLGLSMRELGTVANMLVHQKKFFE